MVGSLRTFVCGTALLVALAAPVWADIRYTTEMTMQMGGESQPTMTMTTQVKGKRERVDMDIDMGPMKMRRTTLTLCDLRQRMEVSDAAKIYAVSPLDPASQVAMASRGPKEPAPKKTGTGQMITTVTVKDLGREKLGQFNTEHYMINMTIETTGCAGNDKNSFDSEVWVSAAVPVFSCPDVWQPNYVTENDGCKISYVMKGDVKLFTAIHSGLIVQRKFTQPDGGAMIQRVTSYEGNVTLKDADFQAPAGYTKVSSGEFEQAAMKAMMQQMQMPPQEPQEEENQ